MAKSKPKPAAAPEPYPTWEEIKPILLAEMEKRGGVSACHKLDPSFQWSSFFTAVTRTKNASFDIAMRIIALVMPLAELEKRIHAARHAQTGRSPVSWRNGCRPGSADPRPASTTAIRPRSGPSTPR